MRERAKGRPRLAQLHLGHRKTTRRRYPLITKEEARRRPGRLTLGCASQCCQIEDGTTFEEKAAPTDI
jgi:hypothetical protein